MLFFKKSQIGIFIIIGVISLVVGVYVISSDSLFKSGPSKSEIAELDNLFLESKTYVDSCVEQILKNGLIVIGIQGGYFNPPSYEYMGDFKVPYYFDGDKSSIPDKSKIESELSDLVSSNFYLCVLGVSSQNIVGINFSDDDYANAKIRFSNDEVYVNVDFAIEYSINGNKKLTLNTMQIILLF